MPVGRVVRDLFLRAAFRFGSGSDSLRWMWDHQLDWTSTVA